MHVWKKLQNISHLIICFSVPFLIFQNIIWSFGLNRNVPVLNLTDGTRTAVMYVCAHTGVLYDYRNNNQTLLQGHVSLYKRLYFKRTTLIMSVGMEAIFFVKDA